MALDPQVMALATAAMHQGNKVSIFDAAGRLLWFSADWMDEAGVMENPAEALGWRWLEFVHPDDQTRARAWIAAGDGATVEMRCHSANAADVWLDVIMTKRRAGAYWVAVGDNRRADGAGGISNP